MKNWYGFNMLWMYTTEGKKDISPKDIHIEEKELDFICDMGCNFIRLPIDYRFFIHDFDYGNTNETMLKCLDTCLEKIISRGLHCSLNIHRAPGYCINGTETEKHILWKDIEAQDEFTRLWTEFAARYANYSENQLSFDLLNEPPNIGQYGLTREIHKSVMERVIASIKEVSPHRPIIIDGLGGGNIAMPELGNAGVIHSVRGYQPMALTHYQASWCEDTKGLDYPIYPGTNWDEKVWDRDMLLKHYEPWVKVEKTGVKVHVGECGCYNKVDNQLALKWFKDLFSVYAELDWGFALWNFKGDFGIVNHNRKNTRWETINGFSVDRDLYELIRANIK